uniref:Claudin i n=1 Tax=Poecilia reticulata TaxID=8081 RepID=A0A3P9P250_POERE
MESNTVQMVCVALGAIGLIGVITCCSLPEWLVLRSYSYPVLEQHYGLWMECGPEECTQFGFVLAAKPSGLQAARAMTVSSCILCGLSLCFLIYGADFTTCVQNKNSKTKRIQVAGVDLLLAGLLVIIPVSLWAHNILRNKQCHSRDIGTSIYIGWAAGVLMILTQGLLLSFGRPRSRGSAGGSSSSSAPVLEQFLLQNCWFWRRNHHFRCSSDQLPHSERLRSKQRHVEVL